MRPLQSIAMGLVIVVLYAEFGRYDALADPAGWALVLLGAAHLPADLERRGLVVGLAALALAVSVPLWWPPFEQSLTQVDPALAWAVNLPALAFGGLLATVLARRASDAGDRGAAAGGRTTALAFAVAAVLPVLVLGGGVEALGTAADAAFYAAHLMLVWFAFAWSGRPWARTPEVEPDRPAS